MLQCDASPGCPVRVAVFLGRANLPAGTQISATAQLHAFFKLKARALGCVTAQLHVARRNIRPALAAAGRFSRLLVCHVRFGHHCVAAIALPPSGVFIGRIGSGGEGERLCTVRLSRLEGRGLGLLGYAAIGRLRCFSSSIGAGRAGLIVADLSPHGTGSAPFVSALPR